MFVPLFFGSARFQKRLFIFFHLCFGSFNISIYNLLNFRVDIGDKVFRFLTGGGGFSVLYGFVCILLNFRNFYRDVGDIFLFRIRANGQNPGKGAKHRNIRKRFRKSLAGIQADGGCRKQSGGYAAGIFNNSHGLLLPASF